MRRFLFILLCCFTAIAGNSQSNRIPVLRSDGTKTNIFLSGGNLAWDQFANDFGPGQTNFALFDDVFAQWEAAGGNSMRLWVHINGANNPNFDGNGKCTGLEASHIPDMKKILDMAYNHNITLVLSLWSFDMLNTRDYPAAVSDNALKLLTVESNIQSYIDNALIPMVTAFKDHPAVAAWEIFNEPEGMSDEFGWAFVKHVPMSTIQRFVNRLAGAIHRTDPDALVTNGTWALYANTDVLTSNVLYKNYYTDSRLIAAGGDINGTLDFYQVHYYDWMPNEICIMNHPASYWKLDKPLLAGEFFPLDAVGISWSTYYKYLYDNGYAGALAWAWQGNNNSLEPYRTNMLALMKSMSTSPDVKIETNRNHIPNLGLIPKGLFDTNAGTISNYFDLDSVATDIDGDALSFSVIGNTYPGLVTVTINTAHQIVLAIAPNTTGTAKITIQAKDPKGLTSSSDFSIVVKTPGTGNLALYRTTVFTSGNEIGTSCADPLLANDGDYNTRWASAYADPSWYYVDLGKAYPVNEVKLFWEAAYGKMYQIQVSNDAIAWTTVYTESAGNGGTDDLTFPAVNARYVRMYGTQRATTWGYSLYEFEVYGTGLNVPATGVSILPSAATIGIGGTTSLAATVTPSDATYKSVTWTSSNTAIVTVSTDGIVTGMAKGSAIITAKTTDGGFTATSTITVSTIPVTSVTILPATATINIGETTVLAATVAPINATDKTVSWTSSNIAVATVSNLGVATGVGKGSAIITAKTTDGGFTATSAVTVNSVAVTGVTVLPTSISIITGGTATLVPTIAPANASNKSISWTSSNTSVATVSALGVVTAVAPGSAVVTVKTADGAFTASSAITVADVIISCSNAVPITLPFTFNGSGEYCWSITGTINSINNWSVDLFEINGVNYSNKFANTMPAKINGVYYIHYRASLPYGHIEIAGTSSGVVNVTGVSVLPATATINIGGTAALTPTVTPTNASDKSVSYTSSNTAIATVSATGVVTGIAAGSAIITVKTTDGGFTATSSITVQNTTVRVTGVSVLPATATINIGGTAALTPTVTPTNASDKSVSYTSSNTAIATVSATGVVTGIAAGSAIITVKTTDGGFTATSSITVQNTTVRVTGVSVLPATATINVGGTAALTPTITPTNASDKSVSYTSSNTAVAAVSAAGVVTGIAAGSAIITVKTTDGGFTATSTITVNIVTTACSNPVAITVPITQNGVGEFCWVTSQGMAYINSWNMDLVEINGVAYTNKWASNIPASSDGKWYIHYKASLAWAHFEAAALKNAETITADNIRIYPNPFSTEINIDFGGIENIQKVEIYNNLGQLVQDLQGSQLKSPIMNLNMSNIAGNIFIFKIYVANKIIVKQVVRQ